MPVPKKRTELIVGLFILVGMVMLGGLVLQFGKFRERLMGQYPLTIVFDDASGVIKGSEVRMGGARIGGVAKPPELNAEVRVEVELSINDAIHIPKGSAFQINSATLLGDKLIVVVPPADRDGGEISAGSRLEGGGLTGLDAIQNNAEEVSRDVMRIIKEAEGTFKKVDAAVVEIRSAGDRLREAMDKVNERLLSDQNLSRFDSTMENLSATSGHLNESSNQLEPALTEAREAIRSVKAAAATAEGTLKSADQAIAGLKPSLEKIPLAVDEFHATTRKAGETLDRINKGEGMLGAMATDNDVAFDFKTFMRNLKNYGVLRYKNAAPGSKESKEESSDDDGARRFGPRIR